MQLIHERRLLFAAGPHWKGWFCERCCWCQLQPENESEAAAQARRIRSEFEVHDCEKFARKHWPKPPGEK
jgi:hypothetical protein